MNPCGAGEHVIARPTPLVRIAADTGTRESSGQLQSVPCPVLERDKLSLNVRQEMLGPDQGMTVCLRQQQVLREFLSFRVGEPKMLRHCPRVLVFQRQCDQCPRISCGANLIMSELFEENG